MEPSLLATLVFGFGLGLQHSFDADHLVAMSTMVGRSGSVPRAAVVGAIWGLGHTAALLAAALAVIALRVSVAPAMAATLEVGVGVMLIVLGGDVLLHALGGALRIHSHANVQEGGEHRHPHEHTHPGTIRRPFFVGVVHGLAGSAALMLAVLGTIGDAWTGLLYVAVFGCGTIVGMLALSTLLGLPFVLGAR